MDLQGCSLSLVLTMMLVVKKGNRGKEHCGLKGYFELSGSGNLSIRLCGKDDCGYKEKISVQWRTIGRLELGEGSYGCAEWDK